MSLQNRSRGFEFAEFEKELIFRKENTGLVQHKSKDGRLFSLNVSQNFQNLKDELFYAESCEPPPENTYIEVEVASEDVARIPDGSDWKNHVLKKISGWKFFDPGLSAKRKKLVNLDQVIDFFSCIYRGNEEIAERIATCAALYAFSSPPITNEIGGVKTAIFSKKPQWDALKKPLKMIPQEFFLPSSKFYYCISDKEKIIPPVESEEINIAFLRPEKLMVDIPIFIDDFSIKGMTGVFKDDFEDKKKFVTGYLLDSLMISPNPMKPVEKKITDAVYEIRDDYLKSGLSQYRQNLGDAIPTLTASITRMHLDSDVKPNYVDKVVDLWKEMHKKVKHRIGDSLPISKYYEFSDNTRKLYTELYDIFGKEYPIPFQEVLNVTTVRNDNDFTFALNELVERGFAIRDKRGITLLEKWGQ